MRPHSHTFDVDDISYDGDIDFIGDVLLVYEALDSVCSYTGTGLPPPGRDGLDYIVTPIDDVDLPSGDASSLSWDYIEGGFVFLSAMDFDYDWCDIRDVNRDGRVDDLDFYIVVEVNSLILGMFHQVGLHKHLNP